MEILAAIHRRRSVRDYKPDKVPADLLRQLIAAASWAPSAMNEQPCHFTVVTDMNLMSEISDHAKAFTLKNLPAMPRSVHFQDILGDPHFNIFYNAPALLVISTETQGPWSIEDCALAAETAMLAALNFGLGSCWIGFAQAWLKSEEGLKVLGLSQSSRAVAPLIIGYPKAEMPQVARKSPAVNWIGDGLLTQVRFCVSAIPGVHQTLLHF